jgi:hypothetical protein
VILTDNMILGRRVAYGCCAAEYAYQSMVEDRYGNTKCAKEKFTLAEAYWWAEGVMRRTPMSTDDSDCLCVSHAFAAKVIKKMDAGCVVCGCGDPSDRPINCELLPIYASSAVVDASFQDAAQPDQSYLIATDISGAGNEWADHLGELVFNGAYTVPTEGAIIYNNINYDHWTVVGGSAYPYFPRIDAQRDGFDITLTSRAPAVNQYFSRNVVIRVSADATNWIGVYVGNEQSIPASVTTTIDDALYVDVTYLTQGDECEYGPFYGSMETAQPPEATRSLRYQGLPLLWTSGTEKMEFFPWNEKEWVICTNIKIDGVQPPSFYAPITLHAITDGIGALFTTDPTLIGPDLEFAVNLFVGDDTGTIYNTSIAFIGARAAMSTGVWRFAAVIRNSADAGIMLGSDFTLVIGDGSSVITSFTGTVISSIAPSYPAPLSYQYNPDTVGNQTVGDYLALTFESYTLNNFYVAKHAPTLTEIAAICYPALYEGADDSWGRCLWLKAMPPDDINSAPFVSGNSPLSPSWKSAEGPGGGLTLTTDKPDWIP